MDHRDLKVNGAWVEFDGGLLAKAAYNCGDNAKQCYVREHFPEGRLELRIVTLDGRHISLGSLEPVGHRVAAVKIMPHATDAKQSTAPRVRRPGENWEESYD